MFLKHSFKQRLTESELPGYYGTTLWSTERRYYAATSSAIALPIIDNLVMKLLLSSVARLLLVPVRC